VSNVAGTLLKIQERKTAKGNSYAVLKLTDLSSVFELFIFSDTLQMNRDILKEGHSLLLTLSKSIVNDNNRLTRINVQKIISLKNLFEKPISEVTFTVKSKDQIERLSKVLNKKGDTKILIELQNNKNTLFFELENLRKVDYNSLNLLKNDEIYSIMS
jgi:DNA polymerase-3 subunit alpha